MSLVNYLLDPRKKLASTYQQAAENYDRTLRANPHLDQEVVNAIIQEKNRIQKLFQELYPEFKGKIFVVVTNNAQREHCAVFLWQSHLYVLVSAALIGRPYDHKEDSGEKAWEWLAQHEIAHLRGNHLPWLFYTRQLFRFSWIWGSLYALFSLLIKELSYGKTVFSTVLVLWIVQTTFGLAYEIKADLVATSLVKDPLVLQEAEKSLIRMTKPAKKTFIEWIYYVIAVIFIDPHPPLSFRRYLLKKRAQKIRVEG